MKTRFWGMLALAVIAGVAGWVLPTPVKGQAAAKSKYKAPRMDDKKSPNLQGIWAVDGWDTSRYSLEWHNGATGIRPGKGSITDPADGIIPYTPAGRQKQQANFKARFKEDPLNK